MNVISGQKVNKIRMTDDEHCSSASMRHAKYAFVSLCLFFDMRFGHKITDKIMYGDSNTSVFVTELFNC